MMVDFVVNELVRRVGCVYLMEYFLCLILWEKQNYCLLVHYLMWYKRLCEVDLLWFFTPAAVKFIMIELEIAQTDWKVDL